jgi:hypothetical protein
MKAARNIVSVDVILHVKNVIRSADKPATFKTSLENAVTALNVVAGLKKVIRSDRSQASNTLPEIQMPYLISSYHYATTVDAKFYISERLAHYQSIDISPDLPPPRSV